MLPYILNFSTTDKTLPHLFIDMAFQVDKLSVFNRVGPKPKFDLDHSCWNKAAFCLNIRLLSLSRGVAIIHNRTSP